MTLYVRSMFLTGIPNGVVLLLKGKNKFLQTADLQEEDMTKEALHESDVRAHLNTNELSFDKLYKSLN